MGACLGNFVFIAGAVGSDCDYLSVQAAVTAAEAAALANPGQNMTVLITPGAYAEDVLVRSDRIRIVGLGAYGAVVVQSITFTDATLASLALFDASGDPTTLVKDGAIPDVTNGAIENLICYRNGGPMWHPSAEGSIRLLGSDTVDGAFLADEFHLKEVTSIGIGMFSQAFVATQATDVASHECSYRGSIKSWQFGRWEFHHCRITRDLWGHYDSTLNHPGVGQTGIIALQSTVERYLRVSGDVAMLLLVQDCSIDALQIDTSGVRTNTLEECFIRSGIQMPNIGPLVNFYAGRHLMLPAGPGAVGWTGFVGFNS